MTMASDRDTRDPRDTWDPFTPETAEEARIEAVKGKFRSSLVERAERRLVASDANMVGSWVVAGDARLGDAHDQYRVGLDPATHRYVCSCYGSAWGDVRAKRICSHVLAVILHRKRDQKRDPKRAVGATGAVVAGPIGGPVPATAPAEVEVEVGIEVEVGVPDPRDLRFGRPPLPGWVKAIRPHQWAAVQEIVAHYRAGKKVVLVDAPTGSGKTLLAELVRRELGVKGLYICTTKQLQGQVMGDFPYARMLKGRANYPTLDHGHMFDVNGADRITCDDCTLAGGECDFCSNPKRCPYQVAKNDALAADLAVLNTAYYLSEANHVGRFRPEFVIADECDELEAALMGFVEVTLGPADRKKLALGVPEKKTVEGSWVEWLDRAVAAVQVELAPFPEKPTSARQAKRKRKWERKLQQLEFVREGVKAGGWVYDHSRSDWVTFKPVRVDRFGQRLLWSHASRWLLMSATTISFDQMAADLGLEDGEWASVQVPSTFPVERRPVYVAPVANLTHKTEEGEWGKAADALVSILERHPGESVLVHTQSYRLNGRLFDHLAGMKTRPVYTYRDAQGREEALRLFGSVPGAVLLAPSMQRGVSLDDESCRVVVVVKVPFASLGDPQVAKRLYSTGRAGQTWYAVNTVRSLVQATGRGMRHRDDWCVTYVLDRQFVDFYRRNSRLFPRWWREAVNTTFDVRTLRRK